MGQALPLARSRRQCLLKSLLAWKAGGSAGPTLATTKTPGVHPCYAAEFRVQKVRRHPRQRTVASHQLRHQAGNALAIGGGTAANHSRRRTNTTDMEVPRPSTVPPYEGSRMKTGYLRSTPIQQE